MGELIFATHRLIVLLHLPATLGDVLQPIKRLSLRNRSQMPKSVIAKRIDYFSLSTATPTAEQHAISIITNIKARMPVLMRGTPCAPMTTVAACTRVQREGE